MSIWRSFAIGWCLMVAYALAATVAVDAFDGSGGWPLVRRLLLLAGNISVAIHLATNGRRVRTMDTLRVKPKHSEAA